MVWGSRSPASGEAGSERPPSCPRAGELDVRVLRGRQESSVIGPRSRSNDWPLSLSQIPPPSPAQTPKAPCCPETAS